MGPITLSLGLACAVAAAFTLIGRDYRRDHDDGLVAVGLVYVWAISATLMMIVTEFLPPSTPPVWMIVGPVLDLSVGVYVARLHKRAPSRWKLVVVLISAFQLTAHVAMALGDKSAASVYAYKFALNVSFVAQLLCVITPGGSFGFRRRFRRLPDRPRRFRH